MPNGDFQRSTDQVTPHAGRPQLLKLVVLDGPDFGKELLLKMGTYRIGAAEGNELVLHDRAVSKGHLQVEVLQSALKLIDLGSRNGSFCDGKRFREIEASAGATLRLGRTHLKILPAQTASTAVAPLELDQYGELVGKSIAMRQLYATLERVAKNDAAVLLLGEPGVGKSLCAKAIHQNSSRAAHPFVACDLGSLASSLAESELFGHARGAFTGAVKSRAGVIEQANGGTLFLDEVGNLPVDLQPRLLRAVESGEIKRLGQTKSTKVNLRIISAIAGSVEHELETGRLRRDLYERLSTLEVRVPPLRERKDDVPLLIAKLGESCQVDTAGLSPELISLLTSYDWPGNVRQLRNVVSRIGVFGEAAAKSVVAAKHDTPSDALADLESPPREGALSFKDAKDRAMQRFERMYLQDLLLISKGNVSKAAADAGMDRTYLHKLIKKYGLTTK